MVVVSLLSEPPRKPKVALVIKNLPANAGDIRDAGSIPGLGRSPGERPGNPLQYSCLENPMDEFNYSLPHIELPRWCYGKELACQCRRHKRCWFDPWVGKIPGGRHGSPLQYSCLKNPMTRGTWQARVHRVTRVGCN